MTTERSRSDPAMTVTPGTTQPAQAPDHDEAVVTNVYHVLARGHKGRILFHDAFDCQRYLRLLLAVKPLHSLRIYHFTLLPNHVHLLVDAHEYALAEAMATVNLGYSAYHQTRYGSKGRLWQGRSTTLLMSPTSDLLTSGRDLELNPIRAGLSSAPHAYPWTSYHVYAEGAINPLIDLNPDYVALAGTPQARRARYQQYLDGPAALVADPEPTPMTDARPSWPRGRPRIVALATGEVWLYDK